MAIDPKKILTISATEYCIMTHQRLEDFVAEGVTFTTEKVPEIQNLKRAFSRSINSRVEIVVGYQVAVPIAHINNSQFEYTVVDGTALIPKNSIESAE